MEEKTTLPSYTRGVIRRLRNTRMTDATPMMAKMATSALVPLVLGPFLMLLVGVRVAVMEMVGVADVSLWGEGVGDALSADTDTRKLIKQHRAATAKTRSERAMTDAAWEKLVWCSEG